MGCCCCCVSNEERNNGDRRAGILSFSNASVGTAGHLFISPSFRGKEHVHNTFNQHADQNIQDVIDALLIQQSEDNEEKQRLLNKTITLQTENENLQQELLEERKTAEKTKAALEEAKKKTVEDTKAMSRIMEIKNTGGHEAANNPFSPTKLGVKLKTVYEDLGLPLLEYFDDEIEGAKFLSNLIKSCYDFCKRKAGSQVTKFCFLDGLKLPNVDEVDEELIGVQMRMMMSEDDLEDIYYLRWKTATSKEAIDRIKQEVSGTFSFQDQTYSHIYKDETKAAAVKSFLQMCAETCWLIATCRPALRLKFDVVNLMYDLRIKKAFSVFATQKKVLSVGSPPGVIIVVMCPALITADDRIYMPGEVITTNEEGRCAS